MSPLPEDVQLPCGWVCKRVCADTLVCGHEDGSLEVEATRTDDSQLLPFDLTNGWELTCRIRAGESMSERVIGRVTTRAAATEGLRSCMERVSTLARTRGSGELSPALIAEDIELRGEIPSTNRYAMGD
ncbi:MAG TPA: hypothetical protein VFJ06_09035 [Halococcus sp.]|nr:hypothetical protein [Halococcus sp.]